MVLYIWSFTTSYLIKVAGIVDTEDTEAVVVLVVDVDATIAVEVVDVVGVMYS